MRDAHAPRFGPTRAGVFEHLQGLATPAPLDAIAEAVGIDQNTARLHLDALTSAGPVERQIERREVPGRPKVHFRGAQPWEVRSIEPWASPTTCGVNLLHHSPSANGRNELADA
jgi:hypothetical protein